MKRNNFLKVLLFLLLSIWAFNIYADSVSSTGITKPQISSYKTGLGADLIGVYNWVSTKLGDFFRGKYVVKQSSADQGSVGTAGTLANIINSLAGDKALIELSGPYTYTLTTNLTVPNNIILVNNNGALIGGSGNLIVYSPDHLRVSKKQQIKTGTGTLTFTTSGDVFPELWGIDGTADDVQLQAANDSLPSTGGTVVLDQGKTYSVTATKSLIGHGGATLYYGIKPSSNVNWVGGAGTIVQLAANQSAGGHDPNVFCTNAALENVTFKGFSIDINGSNNDIASELNTTALYVGGDSAYPKKIRLINMEFKNCPGFNHVVLGVSNSTSATIGDDILVDGCRFYQGGIDSVMTDHTSFYSYADNVRIVNSHFVNESTNITGRKYGSAFELHGSNNIAKGNSVLYYARGCYMAMNYVQASSNQIVSNNTFRYISGEGVNAISAGANAKNLSNLLISNNIIELIDDNVRSGYGIRITPSMDIQNISILNNEFTKSGGDDQDEFAIYIQPDTASVIDTITIKGNTIADVVKGVLITTTAGTVNNLILGNNTFHNLIRKDSDISIGFNSVGAGLKTLIAKNNDFIDDQITKTFDYGFYLNGTINKLVLDNNYYEGLHDYGYAEAAFTTVEKIIDGAWEYYVSAAASGGSNTFVVTITLNTSAYSFGVIVDLIGRYDATENIYKQFAFSGALITNTMVDGSSVEVLSIGDTLKSQLTVGNPVAVGSNHQFTITFTNADDHSFTGQLRLHANLQKYADIESSRGNAITGVAITNH
jgi:hypothetical protein